MGVRSASVVEDEMKLELGRCRTVDLAKEGKEFARSMARGNPSQNPSGRYVEGCVMNPCPVALVVARGSLDLSGSHRKKHLSSIQGLSRSRRQRDGAFGRREDSDPEANNVLDLFCESGIGADLEVLYAMRFQICGLPNFPHMKYANVGRTCHQPETPMNRLARNPL